MRKAENNGRTGASARRLRWMEALWEGTSTSAREENKKEEVLAVFRKLAEDSARGRQVREYAPWEPPW